MTTRLEAEETLRALASLTDDEIDLGEAALALAALDRPRVPLQRYRDHLQQLVDDTGASAERSFGAGAEGLLDALNDAIIAEHGYCGDTLTYDDLQNANLIRVIDRRKGLPVALGVLYLHTAHRLGWQARGLNFPGNF